MRLMSKRLAGMVLAAAALAAPLTAAAPTANAAAASCTHPSWGPNDPGFAYTHSGGTTAMHTGPYAACATSFHIPATHEFSIDCKFDNGTNIWYHGDVFVGGVAHSGWVYSGNLVSFHESNGAWC